MYNLKMPQPKGPFEADPKSLENLVAWAKAYGWNGDYGEVQLFVIWVFENAKVDCPDLTPDDPTD
jgi:hypothetical protein